MKANSLVTQSLAPAAGTSRPAVALAAFLACAFCAGGCGSDPSGRAETAPGWDENRNSDPFELTIPETTQGRLGEWRVGVGNIFEDTYRAADGESRRGLVVTLYLYHERQGQRSIDGYVGKTFELDGKRYQISKLAYRPAAQGHVVISGEDPGRGGGPASRRGREDDGEQLR